MAHHAVFDVSYNLAMTKTAGLLRNPKISRVNEANELG
jgi:hypothetical protein